MQAIIAILVFGFIICPPVFAAQIQHTSFFRFHADNNQIPPILLQNADAVAQEMIHDLGLPLQKPINVIIASTAEEFQRSQPEGSRVPAWAIGVAYPQDNLIILLSPAVRQRGPIDIIKTFQHEVLHIILGQAFKGKENIPRWLDEGLAMIAANEWNMARLSTMTFAVLGRKTIPMQQLTESFALKVLCDTLDIPAAIIATTAVSLEQNRQLITDLSIPLTFLEEPPDIRPYDAYIVADHQSAQVEFIKNKIPCAVHIDHHVPVQEELQIDVNITLATAGATSTMVGLILKELPLALDAALFKRIATALVWGIQTDTDGFTKAQPLDYEALTYLSPYADRVIISRLMGTAVSDQPIGLIAKAIKNKVLYKDWLIAGIGFVEASKRDAIALIADFLLEKENASLVAVFAAVESDSTKGMMLDVSVRVREETFNLDSLIKQINPNGGARKFKGAYQINLDYFKDCPDRNRLWEVVNATTLQIFKTHRDAIPVVEVKNFFDRLKSKLSHIFR